LRIQLKLEQNCLNMLGKQISNVQVYGDQTVSGQKTFTDNFYEQGSLNVKGATKMKGTLTVEGAVTLPNSTTFSNPLIAGAITLPSTISIPSSNQLGYSFSGTLTTGLTITNGSVYTIASIVIPSGVWILNSQLVFVDSAGGATTFSQFTASITSTSSVDLSNVTVTRSNAASSQGNYTGQHNVRIVSLTAASTTYYLVASVGFTNAVTLTYSNSYLTATRIA
jgi:hypothetical protein